MSFEWRTDEDDRWSDEESGKETAVLQQSFLRRRWRFLLVSLLGLLAVWLVVQGQIEQRITETTAAIETELLSTHNFVLQTAVDRDDSLFRANLSGRDPAWGEVQETLLTEGLLLDRPMLGWQRLAADERLTAEEVTITLDPGLRAAELDYPQTYAVYTTTGMTETITLRQTAVYREGSRRWLYAPLDDDFWGDWITQGGDYLTLAYTERDRAVATVLAIQLDRLVGQMCADLADLNCGPDFQVHVRFDPDPQVMLAFNEVETMLKAGIQFELPTPTLIGLPTDDASADALYRAYGVQVATAVLAHQTDYDCCTHQLFFQALRDYQLDQLGLQSWPLPEDAYSQMLASGFDGNIVGQWSRRWEEEFFRVSQIEMAGDINLIWQRVYMLVEFLAGEETAVSPTQMMRLINNNSYQGWLADVHNGEYAAPLIASQLLEYIYVQSQGGQLAEPPIPLPDDQIVAICLVSEIGASRNRAFAYDLRTGVWEERLTDLELPAEGYLRTTDGTHFVLQTNAFVAPLSISQFYLISDGEMIFLEEAEINSDEGNFVYYDFVSLPTGLKLMRYEYDSEGILFTLRSLDCPTTGCPEQQFNGYMVVSADGSYAIEHVPVDNVLPNNFAETSFVKTVVALDGDFRRPLEAGGIAYWLNDERYGVAEEGESGWQLRTATIANPEFVPLLAESDLQTVLNENIDLSLPRSHSFPDSNSLILQTEGTTSRGTLNYLFEVSLTDDFASVKQVALLWAGEFSNVVGASPDGRFFVLADWNNESISLAETYYLLDLETLQISEPIRSNYYGFGGVTSWSSDGHWLIQNNENYFLLSAPAYDFQYYIPHGLGDCQQVILSPSK
ncbi:MAG: hypothetical protein H6652_20915 [Ardenticatenaceae bacterium]|nr:hypothetical protein [Ardenticatenaceae bacterium]